jgi:2-oxoglutarate ferredoxin oxidoreductase subunit alpha
MVPLHGDAILHGSRAPAPSSSRTTTAGGSLPAQTSFVPDSHIRKYDGEPFMPHHIVEAVKNNWPETKLSVPIRIMV